MRSVFASMLCMLVFLPAPARPDPDAREPAEGLVRELPAAPTVDDPAATASSARARNVMYAEVGGATIVWAVEYERLLLSDEAFLRIGAGWDGTIMPIPVTIGYVGLRRDAHGLELGAGATFVRRPTTSETKTYGTATVGYRYAPGSGGLTLRLGASLLVGDEDPHPRATGAGPTRHVGDVWRTVAPYLAVGYAF